ncbi:MAG: T9SS type A sorting domain-containing protein [Gemmatimonadales bacterium]|nr:T9SS type A sorting domain-containing protein [Gemmatimonadales bacterium]
MSRRKKLNVITVSLLFLAVPWIFQTGIAMAATGQDHSPLFSLHTTYGSSVSDGGAVPDVYNLSRVYPNPFNPSTAISYDLPRASIVHLAVFDLRGRLIRTLRGGVSEPAGRRTATWNGCDDQNHQVAGGVYFCRLRVGNFIALKSMTLVK